MVAVETCKHLPVVVSVAWSSWSQVVQVFSPSTETVRSLQLCHISGARGVRYVCEVGSLLGVCAHVCMVWCNAECTYFELLPPLTL